MTMTEGELQQRRKRLLDKWAGRLTHWYKATDSAAHAFAFGEGWDDIVDRLMTDLFALGWDGNVDQTKEKFGGLRFYLGEYPDESLELIEAAEAESFRTCEVCGDAGTLRNEEGWFKTLCDFHAR